MATIDRDLYEIECDLVMAALEMRFMATGSFRIWTARMLIRIAAALVRGVAYRKELKK